MTYNILLVDDDLSQINVLEAIVEDKMKYKATVVGSGQEAIDLLTANDAQDIDLVVLDLSMPGVDGISVLNAVKPVKPNLPIIVRTGHDDIDMVVAAMKAGAADFVMKLDEPERLQTSINNALRIHVLNDELSRLKRSIGGQISFSDIIGESPAVKEMIAYGNKVAASNIPVLLEGESGTGKEFMARAIHAASQRKDKPFIAVNCGAIPENLVESILFGHEKGAFTGAVYKTYGKFREADGGTIFLDEVGELTPDIQVKLLRVLQDGEIDPVGSTKPIKVDVRIISATNRELSQEVKERNFREDLFYRLNVFPIYVPPLRDRRGDIKMMIDHYYTCFAASEGKNITGLSRDAEEMLCKYEWPGNIRQLKNTIFRAIVLCEKEELTIEDFPQVSASIAMRNNPDSTMSGGLNGGRNAVPAPNVVNLQEEDGNFRKLRDIEKDVIEMSLKRYNGRMSEISRRLGIGRSTLYRKISEYDLLAEGSIHSEDGLSDNP